MAADAADPRAWTLGVDNVVVRSVSFIPRTARRKSKVPYLPAMLPSQMKRSRAVNFLYDQVGLLGPFLPAEEGEATKTFGAAAAAGSTAADEGVVAGGDDDRAAATAAGAAPSPAGPGAEVASTTGVTQEQPAAHRVLEHLMPVICPFLTFSDNQRMACVARWLASYTGHSTHLRVLARTRPGRTKRGLYSLLQRHQHLATLEIIATPYCPGDCRGYVTPLALESITSHHLHTLILDGPLVNTQREGERMASCMTYGALSQLESLEVRNHMGREEAFSPWFKALVHCPRLRKLALGAALRGTSGLVTAWEAAAVQEGFPRVETLVLEGKWAGGSEGSTLIMMEMGALEGVKELVLRRTQPLLDFVYSAFTNTRKLVLDNLSLPITHLELEPWEVVTATGETGVFSSLSHLEIYGDYGHQAFVSLLLSSLAQHLETLVLSSEWCDVESFLFLTVPGALAALKHLTIVVLAADEAGQQAANQREEDLSRVLDMVLQAQALGSLDDLTLKGFGPSGIAESRLTKRGRHVMVYM